MKILEKLRVKRPLIHNITNYVTVNDVANALISLGASPVMADSELEVCDIVAISNALNINIGTLNERNVKAMIKAGIRANELGVPVVLDPVGVGASEYRTQTAKLLLEKVQFALLRLNISEALVLAGESATTRGVDANENDLNSGVKNAINVAKILSEKFNLIVVISGKTDVIADHDKVIVCENGHEMMSKITGSGCMLTALLAAFVCTQNDILSAAKCVSTYGVCGENAFKKLGSLGNASYRNLLIDELMFISDEELESRMKLKTIS